MPSAVDAIAELWSYWSTVADEIAVGLAAGGVPPHLVEMIATKVKAVHPELEWELGPGRRRAHAFCLSGTGDPLLRVVAERWKHRAPRNDPDWEFHASRQRTGLSGMKLNLGDAHVEVDTIQVRITEDRSQELLHLEVFDPSFVGAEEEQNVRVAFLALDSTLGEDGVQRWIGAVELASAPLEGSVTFAELPALVDAFELEATGERWAVLQGERDGEPVIVSRNLALKRVDHLLLDLLLEIDVPLAEPDPHGLTVTAESARLQTMEDELLEALGDDAVLVARETCAGHRTLLLHVMEGGPVAGEVQRWGARHASYDIGARVELDPRWDVLHRWG